jgi:hypothetical protein
MVSINDTYQIKIETQLYYVYEGLCDDIPTKWLTTTEWNGIILTRLNRDGDELTLEYWDEKGNPIKVFDEDDIEYKHIRR